MATAEQINSLRHFRASEFTEPKMMHEPFLQWLDDIRHAAGVPFIVTSDGRQHVPLGGSSKSLHMVGRAVDIRYPWLDDARIKTNGVTLAKITEAVVGTPRPEGEGGYEYGIELGAAGGPHLHIGLYPFTRKLSWLFTR